jgi:hypothetical protein
MATCKRKVVDRWRTFARAKDQETKEGVPMKCPKCGDSRNSSGETYGPHKVWFFMGFFMGPTTIRIEVSEPSSISGFPHEPMYVRVTCLNPDCHDGFQIDGHEPHSVDAPCIVHWRRCLMRCDCGFLVMRIGQSAMMPVERKSVPFATMPKK